MKTTFKHLAGQPGKITLICLVFISASYLSQAAGYLPFNQLISESAVNLIPAFRVTTDTNIYNTNILLRVTIIQFDCYRQNKDVIIKWRTDDENELLGYELQRSTDQVHFTTISQITPKRGHINDYQFIDNPTEQSIVYYRIKIMYPMYNAYSIIKKLNNSTVIKKSVIIQPNIIQDHIELTIEENGAEWGDIIIHSPQGAIVYSKKQILLTGKNRIILTNLPQIQVGMYFLMIYFSNDKISETSILVKH